MWVLSHVHVTNPNNIFGHQGVGGCPWLAILLHCHHTSLLGYQRCLCDCPRDRQLGCPCLPLLTPPYKPCPSHDQKPHPLTAVDCEDTRFAKHGRSFQ